MFGREYFNIYVSTNDLYSSLNTVRVINSRRMRWAGQVALWGEGRHVQDFGGET